MKTYEVTLFVMGVPPSPALNETVYIDAETQDEAEQKAHDWYFPDGYGVLSSREYRSGLTDEQKKQAREYMSSILSNIITDSIDREDIVSEIEDDVYEDIETCAEWQLLNEDEWCPGDVEIAVARILKERICR